MARSLLILLVVLACFGSLHAQLQSNKSEMTTLVPKHSPKRATLYSAILPGLGQAYNRKYWKIPIVFAGIGTISYFIATYHRNYLQAKEAYNYVANGYDYPINNSLIDKYAEADLLQIRDYYRRNLELSWIYMGLWYILNIIDANVDAHFFDYDISDNLSLQVQPLIESNYSTGNHALPAFQTGVCLHVNF